MKKLVIALTFTACCFAADAPVIAEKEKAQLSTLIIEAQNAQLLADQAIAEAKEADTKAKQAYGQYLAYFDTVRRQLKAGGCKFNLVKREFYECNASKESEKK